ncbi:MAG: hypothetical protein NTW13_00615 [Candidatus Omnitrophica bacterium]|nr:hypothetical protein [Candidatus Omnitrophota bacterium]
MDKKEIYEHLAKIYLDASAKKKKRHKAYPGILKNLFIIGIFFIIGISGALFSLISKSKNTNSETALFIQIDPTKINFNFDPAKKEVYTINLNHLNLSRFKTLGFSVKNALPRNPVTLRIEFTNVFKEKSEVYLKEVPGKWLDFKISLAKFYNINDWSELERLSFIVEQWNVKEKKGVVYIDNVRLLK